MNREQNHFRGESFGGEQFEENSDDLYLKNLVEHYKNCLLLEKTAENPQELMMVVRSVEREIELLDAWNVKMEEMIEIKDLEVERLREDIQNADEELMEVDKIRKELEMRIEKLYLEKSIKDDIIDKQQALINSYNGKCERVSTPKKTVPKSSRQRYESPTLV